MSTPAPAAPLRSRSGANSLTGRAEAGGSLGRSTARLLLFRAEPALQRPGPAKCRFSLPHRCKPSCWLLTGRAHHMMACRQNFDVSRRPNVDRRFCSAAGAALHFSVARPYVGVSGRFRPWLGSMRGPSGAVSGCVTLAGTASAADRQLRTLCSGKAAAWGAAVGGWLLSSVAGGHRSRLFVAERGRVPPCATRAR